MSRAEYMESTSVLDLFRQTGALLEGHFRLTSGLHSNGYSLARKAVQERANIKLDERMADGRTVGEALLDPTPLYTDAARALLGAASVLVMSLSVWQGIQLWPRLLEYQIFSDVAELAGLIR